THPRGRYCFDRDVSVRERAIKQDAISSSKNGVSTVRNGGCAAVIERPDRDEIRFLVCRAPYLYHEIVSQLWPRREISNPVRPIRIPRHQLESIDEPARHHPIADL